VTEADIAIDRVLRTDLRAARPDYGWLSEETEDDAERLSAQRSLRRRSDRRHPRLHRGSDELRPFACRGGWRDVVAGVVYLPMKDKLYAAARPWAPR
jgi:myo-inositol-1(or 4)-monophosphatase